jgi:hypothetical protein
MIIVHGVAWTVYAGVVMTIARCAARDWRNPGEDRRVILVTAGAFTILLAIAGVLIAVI